MDQEVQKPERNTSVTVRKQEKSLVWLTDPTLPAARDLPTS